MSKRTLILQRNLDPVTTAEAAANELVRIIDLNNVTIVLVEAGIDLDTARWNFILHHKNTPSGNGINLGHSLKQRDIGDSVIWEGRIFVPRGWRLSFFAEGQFTAGFSLTTRVLFEGEA